MKDRLYKVIFEADTRSGKVFDVWLLLFILISVLCVIIESVEGISPILKSQLLNAELFFTLVFTLEYIIRILVVKKPLKYIFSFMGFVDFLGILPTYIFYLTNEFYPNISPVDVHYLTIIRSIRLIRIFRIFHLSPYVRGSQTMLLALRSSGPKITVFLLSISIIVVIVGAFMYVIEGSVREDNFQDIPNSIYWAIVTLTTVGYGNVVPITIFGKFIASFMMILGYAIIAVPTGIVSSAMVKNKMLVTTRTCQECFSEGHAVGSEYCKDCGAKL